MIRISTNVVKPQAWSVCLMHARFAVWAQAQSGGERF